MVELDVEARLGDSGGPILNDREELAGVLFGAGRGFTLGSFGGRVETFLATLAPDIGEGAESEQIAARDPMAHPPTWQRGRPNPLIAVAPRGRAGDASPNHRGETAEESVQLAQRDVGRLPTGVAEPPAQSDRPVDASRVVPPAAMRGAAPPNTGSISWREVTGSGWFQQAKSVFAIIGLAAVAVQLLKWAG
jgi:hypothetical protein